MESDKSIIRAEIEKIKQEEALRAAIQHELMQNKPEKQSTKILDVLNSNFGLWLLSAIFISGTGTLYTNNQNKEKVQQQKDETKRSNDKNIADRIDRLSMEFSYRLSTSIINLEAAEKAWIKNPNIEISITSLSALAPLKEQQKELISSLFPEFNNRSGLSLLAELSTIVSAGEQKILKDIIARLSSLLIDSHATELNKPEGFKILAGELLESTHHTRWLTGFHFTDCNKKNPFC